jgi:holo-[acyl-carrier protein] synthase
MIHGIGVDIVQLARVRHALQRYGRRFLDRIYCPGEIETCDAQGDGLASGEGRVVCYAARFAAKEAAFKAFGAAAEGGADGPELRDNPGDVLSWHDFEVEIDVSGAPALKLSERAAAVCERLGIQRIRLSLSSTQVSAAAIVIAEK